jgi:hypothetical protein
MNEIKVLYVRKKNNSGAKWHITSAKEHFSRIFCRNSSIPFSKDFYSYFIEEGAIYSSDRPPEYMVCQNCLFTKTKNRSK